MAQFYSDTFFQVDKLKDFSIWCEDEITDDESIESVKMFMEFLGSCQRQLRKLSVCLPLKNRSSYEAILNILKRCKKLESFIYGVHHKSDFELYQDLVVSYKNFIPIKSWNDTEMKIGSEIRGWYEVRCSFKKNRIF